LKQQLFERTIKIGLFTGKYNSKKKTEFQKNDIRRNKPCPVMNVSAVVAVVRKAALQLIGLSLRWFD
jgi:hypothetical protein